MPKKLVWNGDSISYGAQLDDKSLAFPFLIGKTLNAEVLNYAIGGATAAKQTEAYQDVFLSFADWEHFLKEGKADSRFRYLVRDGFFTPRPYRLYQFSLEKKVWLPGGTESVDCARTPLADRIGEMSPDADIVGIMIGTNDFYYDWTEFGQVDCEEKVCNTTFCGAMHKICQQLLIRYPHSLVILLTPIKRYQPQGIGRGTWDCFNPEDRNHLGLTLDDYRQAIIKIAEYYSFPVIDLYEKSGLNPCENPSFFADKDGKYVHPNLDGHLRMASVAIEEIETLVK